MTRIMSETTRKIRPTRKALEAELEQVCKIAEERGEDLIARTDQVGRAESRIAELEAELAENNAAPPEPPRFDFTAHLERQREWSSKTFGRSARAAGIVDHIRKELAEIEAAPADLGEWIDVAILALDGAWRTGATPEQIIAALEAKQAKNEARKWPPLSEQAEDKATEHDRAADGVLGPDTPRRAFDLLESLVETGEATADERELYRRKKTESQLLLEVLAVGGLRVVAAGRNAADRGDPSLDRGLAALERLAEGEATIRAEVDARPGAPAVMGTILTGLSMMLRTTLGLNQDPEHARRMMRDFPPRRPTHTLEVGRCERCAQDKNRDPELGCSLAPERANGAGDQP